MASSWVPMIIRPLKFRVPRRNVHLTTCQMCLEFGALGLIGIQGLEVFIGDGKDLEFMDPTWVLGLVGLWEFGFRDSEFRMSRVLDAAFRD